MMTDEGLLVESVRKGSLAEEMEIEPGDRLLMVNDYPLRDIIDYNFYSSDDDLLFLVRKKSGELWEVEFERIDDEPLGIYFTAPQPSSCGNNCIFCFVHQLPKGLRKPLYVKDEDYRLSFLYGNYVTLSNIGPDALARIKEQRLSPLYISVHATDQALREKLLGKKGLSPILEVMKELADARITMHTQVVLCPGINDNEALLKTVDDLTGLYPWVSSLAIVPVGITRHRRGLPMLEPVTGEYSAKFVTDWQPRMADIAKKLGEPFLFLSDEFYIKAGLPFPVLDSYGDLPQVENGVGMVPLFLAEAEEVIANAEKLASSRVTVVTGCSPFPYIADFAGRLSSVTGVAIEAVAVKNRLFGEEVTVTGLVCGGDILKEFEDKRVSGLLMIPDVMLKEGEGMLLDDMTLNDLAEKLGCEVRSFCSTPEGFYAALEELAQSATNP
jgi:putative radical SAM enzyme (TIGR03279 family)